MFTKEPVSSAGLLQSESLRYWLEEAQDLELSKDEKCERLNEMVEDLDNSIKAMRQCTSMAHMDKIIEFAKIKISEKLCFKHIRSELQKIKCSPSTSEEDLNNFAALEYLKNYFKKTFAERNDGAEEDVVMSEEQMKAVEKEDADMESALPDVESEEEKTKRRSKGGGDMKKRVVKA